MTTQPFWTPFSYWILNIIEQNREYANFNALVGPRLSETLTNFFIQQYSEVTSKDTIQFIEKVIKVYVAKHKIVLDSKDLEKELLTINTCQQQLPANYFTKKYPTKLQIRGLKWRAGDSKKPSKGK